MVLMKIANVQEMVKIDKSNKWFHGSKFFQSGITSTRGINHARRWFHKWSSTLSDHQMKNASLIYKSSSLANGWPMQWLRGRCPTNLYQGQRSYVWYLKSYTSDVIPIFGSVHKKCKDSSLHHLPQCKPLHQWEAHILWKLMTKGGDCTKIWKLWERLRQRSRGWTWTWTKSEQHWRIWEDQKNQNS